VSVLLMVLIVIMVAYNPPWVLFPAFSLYLISGPITTFRRLRKLKSERRKDKTENL
jgi:CDP-diacylglycerol--serine O-phosphatidyltransferase